MKGIYILIIRVNKDVKIKIGKLGDIEFKRGDYAYIGSAQNNLEKRILRHLKKEKKIHWHIDYLLKNINVNITEVFFKLTIKSGECNTAKEFIKDNQFIEGFGCSDCKCISHLIRFNKSFTNDAFTSHFFRFNKTE